MGPNNSILTDICAESPSSGGFRRTDGAPKLSIRIAEDKAFTSASYGLATRIWCELIADDPPLLHGIIHTPRPIVFGGGFPIVLDGDVVGAIGVSGGHYKQDMECARPCKPSERRSNRPPAHGPIEDSRRQL